MDLKRKKKPVDAQRLWPCPFCGGKSRLFCLGSDDETAYGRCEECGTTSGAWPTVAMAVTAWNRRTGWKGMT